MKMHDYMKKENKQEPRVDWELIGKNLLNFLMINRKRLSCVFAMSIAMIVLSVVFVNKSVGESDFEDISAMKFPDSSIAAASSQKSVITIPVGMVKANPFVPYRDFTENAVVNDVPTFSLVEPPEAVNTNSDAARVMDTVVSGILYDKYSPSAIINIEGNDYLVKKGDVVNNYKVLGITQDSVTVKLGSNSYTAGIGEILTEETVNYNEVSNLKNKFGGEK